MSSIAQLFVELGINTAAFKEGLDKATYQAKQFAKEMTTSLKEAGQSVKELGSAFGQLATGDISGAFDKVQSAIKPMLEELGAAGGVSGTAVAGFMAVGVAATALAVKGAEAAAQLEELSHATGMTVESLSLLGDVAKTKGVGIDEMARSMERMERSALQAAQAGPKAKNAYTDLGLAVTDAQGRMKSAQTLFDEISTKFAAMPDGPEKTAEAMKIFGRAGANMIALLDEGGAHLDELKAHFIALNDVTSGPTAAASAELKENMTLLGAAFGGIQNELTADLVPALNVVAKAFIAFFEENQSEIKAFVDGVAEVAKVTLNVFQELGLVFSLIYRAFFTAVDELQVFGRTVGQVFSDIAGGRFGDIYKDVKAGGKEAADEFKFNMDAAFKSIQDTGKNMVAVNTAQLPKAKEEAAAGGVVAGKGIDLSFMEKQVGALEAQALKEQDLAKAVGLVSAAHIDAKAAAEAHALSEKLVTEAIAKGLSRGAAEKAVAAYTERIKQAATWVATFSEVVASQGALDKFDQKLKENIASLEGQATAMSAAQREFAKNDATLTPLRNNLEELDKEWRELAVNPGTDLKRLNALGDAIKRQSAELDNETEAVKKLDAAWQGVQFAKELEKINQATDALTSENAALLAGNPYGKLESDLNKFIKDMELAPEQAAKLKAALADQEKATAQQSTIKVAQGLGYDPARLQALKAERDSLASLKLPADEYERVLTKINADIADQESKTGGMTAQVRSAFADFSQSVEDANQHIMKDLIGQGIKGIADNFAQMVATGKASWGSLIQSMEAALMKSAISNILNSLFKSLGNAFSNSSNGFLSGLGSMFQGHALGGSVVPGQDYMVGENGPEIMRVDKPATVYPTGHSPSGGGGQTIVQNWNIQTPNADSFGRSQKQLGSQMYREAANAHAKYRG
jgi:hypothetical protein